MDDSSFDERTFGSWGGESGENREEFTDYGRMEIVWIGNMEGEQRISFLQFWNWKEENGFYFSKVKEMYSNDRLEENINWLIFSNFSTG